MDRVSAYRTMIKEVLRCEAERLNRSPQPALETELGFDEVHDNYLLLSVGWTKKAGC
jgi:hypothetical protein